MKTLKNITVHVSNTTVRYTLLYDGTAYGLEIEAKGEFEGYVLVEDAARNYEEAALLFELFADNLVFPANALEIFDDFLGVR